MAPIQHLLELKDIEITAPNRENPDKGPVNVLAQGVTLAVDAGQIVPIVGPSGSGKSTLLRMLVRLAPRSNGEILFEGKAIQTYPPCKFRTMVAYLPQVPVMFPGTVLDNLKTAFQYRSIGQAAPSDDQLANLLEAIGLKRAMLTQRADRLSGGESQRVALLRTLLIEPHLLLLDEPTSGLDPESSRHIVDYVRDWVKQERRAALWVAHDQTVVERLGAEPWSFAR